MNLASETHDQSYVLKYDWSWVLNDAMNLTKEIHMYMYYVFTIIRFLFLVTSLVAIHFTCSQACEKYPWAQNMFIDFDGDCIA